MFKLTKWENGTRKMRWWKPRHNSDMWHWAYTMKLIPIPHPVYFALSLLNLLIIICYTNLENTPHWWNISEVLPAEALTQDWSATLPQRKCSCSSLLMSLPLHEAASVLTHQGVKSGPSRMHLISALLLTVLIASLKSTFLISKIYEEIFYLT